MINVLIFLSVYFILFLVLRTYFSKVCALCGAVSMTWVTGVLYWLITRTYIIDQLWLAMLMGGSAVGFIYYVSSKSKSKIDFFKFPLLVTFFVAIYFILEKSFHLNMAIYVVVLWLLFLIVYILRNKKSMSIFKKIVECCKNW